MDESFSERVVSLWLLHVLFLLLNILVCVVHKTVIIFREHSI